MYADAHCHLGSRQYDNDREDVINRMLEAGVGHAILICCSRHDLLESVKLREQNPGFRLALSIHPQDLEDDYSGESLQQLQRDIEEFRPDMIGETGLDYYSHPHRHCQLYLSYRELFDYIRLCPNRTGLSSHCNCY